MKRIEIIEMLLNAEGEYDTVQKDFRKKHPHGINLWHDNVSAREASDLITLNRAESKYYALLDIFPGRDKNVKGYAEDCYNGYSNAETIDEQQKWLKEYAKIYK